MPGVQAMRAGLKALQGLGVWGVVVNVWWGQAEPSPRQYDWAQYQAVFDAARELGLCVKVREDGEGGPLLQPSGRASCPASAAA